MRTVEELVVQVTGLQPLQQALDHLRQARDICFLPCLHMGRYLSVSESGGCTYVLYDPAHDRSVPTQASQQAETLGPSVEALGDTTRLSIMLLLAEQGELFAEQIAEALTLHPSSVSRSLAQLERGGLVRTRRDGNLKYYTVDRMRVRVMCQALMQRLG